jgi:hypothetical protein
MGYRRKSKSILVDQYVSFSLEGYDLVCINIDFYIVRSTVTLKRINVRQYWIATFKRFNGTVDFDIAAKYGQPE